MTNNELKENIINFYKNKTIFTRPQGGTFFINNIGYTKIGADKIEGFQYSDKLKYVPFSTLFAYYEKVIKTNSLSREWFNSTFIEHIGRPCNYTTIGSIFEKLRIANYIGDGKYLKI